MLHAADDYWSNELLTPTQRQPVPSSLRALRNLTPRFSTLQSADSTSGFSYMLDDNLVLDMTLDLGAEDSAESTPQWARDTDGLSLSLYGSYGFNDFVVDSEIGFQQGFSGALQPLSPRFKTIDEENGRFFVGVGLGYPIASGPFTITPSVNFDYLNITTDPQTTRGLGIEGVSNSAIFAPTELRSLTSALGGQMSYHFERPWGLLVPHVQLQWVYELDNGAVTDRTAPNAAWTDQSARLDSGSATSLSASPSGIPDNDYFNLGLGVSAQFKEGGAAFLSYEKVFGKQDVQADYTVTGGVRFEF